MILVMSEDTRISVKEEIFDEASKQEDPIEYIKLINEVEIVVDDSLVFGVIELWSKEGYYDFKDGE